LDYVSDLLENRFVPNNVMVDAPEHKKITVQDVYEYVNSLQNAVEIWYKMWNPMAPDSDFTDEIKIWLDKINRLDVSNSRILILSFFQSEKSEKSRIAFLKAIERQEFIMKLFERYYPMNFGGSPWVIDQLSLAISLRRGKLTSDKVTRKIIEKTTHMLNLDEFQQIPIRFRSEGFYSWRSIRYFLFEYNLDLQQKSKTDRAKIAWPEFNEQKQDFISVEHIYPRQAKNKYWTSRFSGFSQKRKEALRDSLGNLLPLSKPKNSSLSNRPFPEKRDGHKENVVSYRYGCYAENEVAEREQWSPDEILQRGLKMLKFMEQRWDIKIGDDDQKKIMLGLDFIKE
jgi:hypothetical protein